MHVWISHSLSYILCKVTVTFYEVFLSSNTHYHIWLYFRDLKNTKNTGNPGKEVVGLMKSGETCILAVSMEDGWSVMDHLWLFHLPNKSRNDGHLFELTGPKMVCVYSK